MNSWNIPLSMQAQEKDGQCEK